MVFRHAFAAPASAEPPERPRTLSLEYSGGISHNLDPKLLANRCVMSYLVPTSCRITSSIAMVTVCTLWQYLFLAGHSEVMESVPWLNRRDIQHVSRHAPFIQVAAVLVHYCPSACADFMWIQLTATMCTESKMSAPKMYVSATRESVTN